jgi:preprotein translocase YajC subunit
MVNYLSMTLAQAATNPGAPAPGGEVRPLVEGVTNQSSSTTVPPTQPGSTVTPPGQTPGNPLTGMLPLLLIVGVFALMMWWSSRNQRKEKKRMQAMLDAMKKGDKVVTIGGLIAVITELREDEVVVRGEDGQRMRFRRSAISTILSDKEADVKA